MAAVGEYLPDDDGVALSDAVKELDGECAELMSPASRGETFLMAGRRAGEIASDGVPGDPEATSDGLDTLTLANEVANQVDES